MSIATEVADAILRVRPDTKPHDALRIAGNFAAGIRSELRWLDVYEDKPSRVYEGRVDAQ